MVSWLFGGWPFLLVSQTSAYFALPSVTKKSCYDFRHLVSDGQWREVCVVVGWHGRVVSAFDELDGMTQFSILKNKRAAFTKKGGLLEAENFAYPGKS